VNAVRSERASVEDVCISATLQPLTSSSDMISLPDIHNTFPPYDSSVGILHTSHTQQQRMSMLSVHKNYWHWFGLQTGIR